MSERGHFLTSLPNGHWIFWENVTLFAKLITVQAFYNPVKRLR